MWKCFGCGNAGAMAAGSLCVGCGGEHDYVEPAMPNLTQHNITVHAAQSRPFIDFGSDSRMEQRTALEKFSSGLFRFTLSLAALISTTAVGGFVVFMFYIAWRVFTYQKG